MPEQDVVISSNKGRESDERKGEERGEERGREEGRKDVTVSGFIVCLSQILILDSTSWDHMLENPEKSESSSREE